MTLSPTFQLAIEREIKEAYLRGKADGKAEAQGQIDFLREEAYGKELKTRSKNL